MPVAGGRRHEYAVALACGARAQYPVRNASERFKGRMRVRLSEVVIALVCVGGAVSRETTMITALVAASSSGQTDTVYALLRSGAVRTDDFATLALIVAAQVCAAHLEVDGIGALGTDGCGLMTGTCLLVSCWCRAVMTTVCAVCSGQASPPIALFHPILCVDRSSSWRPQCRCLARYSWCVLALASSLRASSSHVRVRVQAAYAGKIACLRLLLDSDPLVVQAHQTVEIDVRSLCTLADGTLASSLWS